jgi:hypothetical protein
MSVLHKERVMLQRKHVHICRLGLLFITKHCSSPPGIHQHQGCCEQLGT